jgi:hypothetical protein
VAIFPESLAAGLALADQALLLAGSTQEQAAQIIRKVRAVLNSRLRQGARAVIRLRKKAGTA